MARNCAQFLCKFFFSDFFLRDCAVSDQPTSTRLSLWLQRLYRSPVHFAARPGSRTPTPPRPPASTTGSSPPTPAIPPDPPQTLSLTRTRPPPTPRTSSPPAPSAHSSASDSPSTPTASPSPPAPAQSDAADSPSPSPRSVACPHHPLLSARPPLPRPPTGKPPSLPFPLTHAHSPHSTATASAPSIPDPIKDPADPSSQPAPHNDPWIPPQDAAPKPELSIPPTEPSPPTADPSKSPEPLTPLTPLTPSPESSPSLPGHDRQLLPPQDPLPPPVPLDTSPSGALNQQSSADAFTPPPLPTPPISLTPTLDTLIPFEGLHPPFDPELSVQIPPPSCPPSTPPQLQGLELQDQFHSFPPPQLYVPPNPVFVRDREINIWKLACQERVDYLCVHHHQLLNPSAQIYFRTSRLPFDPLVYIFR